VAQKKDIKRQKERLEALKKEAEQEKVKAKEAARERVLAEFEKGQLGLAAVASVTTSGTDAPGNWVCPYYSERPSIINFISRPWNQAKIRFRFHSSGKVGPRSRGGSTASNRA
jgi:nitric oxide synthase-interacting protein